MAFISDTMNTKPVSPVSSNTSFSSALKSKRNESYLRTKMSTAIAFCKNRGMTPIDSGTQNRLYEEFPEYWEGDSEDLIKDVRKLSLIGNIDPYDRSVGELIKKNVYSYNRFKLPFTTGALTHTMSHVFFTRPDCNLFEGNNLTRTAGAHPTISSTYMRNPMILTGLTHTTPSKISQAGNFNLLLSNAATSFQLTDEYIETGQSSSTLDGHQIAYGKLNTKSKASGSFTVSFDDDRNLSIYQQVKVWTDYISAVYIGEIDPSYKSVINREIDYAANAYYILTAEDGYTILFWSKYYGVFPKSIPSSQYSWTKGNSLSMPALNVEFQYSFKEDYVLDTIEEFNTDSFYGSSSTVNANNKVLYEPAFDSRLNRVGCTWVGLPFIDTVKTDGNNNKSVGNMEMRLMFSPFASAAKY